MVLLLLLRSGLSLRARSPLARHLEQPRCFKKSRQSKQKDVERE